MHGIYWYRKMTLFSTLLLEGGEEGALDDQKRNSHIFALKWKMHISHFFQESPVKESNVFITENSLIIRGVHEGNDGEYRCKAKNQIGQGVSEPQRVRVKGMYESITF